MERIIRYLAPQCYLYLFTPPKIDSALTAVEKSNASLKGALPDNYFSCLGLDGSKLSALIDAINNINTVADKEEVTV